MRLFVYSMRTFDELPFFEKFCAKYNVEYDYTTETPCLENLDMAAGYDVVDVITTVFDKPMLKKLYDLGIKCIATRTIGYDHIDVEYAKELGLGVIHISYSPNSVADYTIMMMLMGCRKMKHIMERAAIQDYTLKGKLGRELPDCTVGIIGLSPVVRRVAALHGYLQYLLLSCVRRSGFLCGFCSVICCGLLYLRRTAGGQGYGQNCRGGQCK